MALLVNGSLAPPPKKTKKNNRNKTILFFKRPVSVTSCSSFFGRHSHFLVEQSRTTKVEHVTDDTNYTHIYYVGLDILWNSVNFSPPHPINFPFSEIYRRKSFKWTSLWRTNCTVEYYRWICWWKYKQYKEKYTKLKKSKFPNKIFIISFFPFIYDLD